MTRVSADRLISRGIQNERTAADIQMEIAKWMRCSTSCSSKHRVARLMREHQLRALHGYRTRR